MTGIAMRCPRGDVPGSILYVGELNILLYVCQHFIFDSQVLTFCGQHPSQCRLCFDAFMLPSEADAHSCRSGRDRS